MNHTAVLGSGSWGTALAFAAAQKSPRVTLWGHQPATAEALNRSRENTRYLPGIMLPAPIHATADFSALSDAELSR